MIREAPRWAHKKGIRNTDPLFAFKRGREWAGAELFRLTLKKAIFTLKKISTIFAPMLKRLTAIFLLVALISSNFSRFLVYAGFELNHKYIAENLCVNKSRPWMHCNGHCYFMRKIKEAQENEKKQERENQKSRYQDALPVSLQVSILAFKMQEAKITYPTVVTPETIQRSYSILLPPKVASLS
jgi:hypothetical protein